MRRSSVSSSSGFDLGELERRRGPGLAAPGPTQAGRGPGSVAADAHAAAAAKISLNFAAANLPGLAPIEVPRSELQVGSGFPDFQWHDAGPGRA
jgi:hypothetical protein